MRFLLIRLRLRTRHLLLAAVALLSLPSLAAHAQQSDSPASATPDEVYRWLLSSDPRMVAWGAYFAAQHNDMAMLPFLARLAENWQPMPSRTQPDGNYRPWTDAEADRLREMSAVLDAIIQMHGTVAPEAIERLAVDFDGQALTLFAYLPEPQRRTQAEAIYAQRQPQPEGWADGTAMNSLGSLDRSIELAMAPNHPPPQDSNVAQQKRFTRQLLQMVARILANDPPPGFAASLLNETTVDLELSVGGNDPNAGMGTGPGCGDSLYITPPKGWPASRTYVVEQQPQAEKREGVEVLIPGAMTITTRRAMTSSSCSTIGYFSSYARIELLAQMLGVDGQHFGWRLDEYTQLPYTGDITFQQQAQAEIAKREEAFKTTAEALVAKGLATAAEAATARPQLYVGIRDARELNDPPLPAVSLTLPKVKEIVWSDK